MGLNPVRASKIENDIALRSAHYARVQLLKEYAQNETPDLLTTDQKIRMVGASSTDSTQPAYDPEFGYNICDTVLSVEVDRLDVQSIDVVVPDNEEASERLTMLVRRWWKRNRMDEGQQHAHFAACRDGDAYGVTWWDNSDPADAYPRVSVNQVYDGQNAGADMFYVDGDPTQPESGIKIWIAEETDTKTIRRKNVYYTDRIEKWVSEGGILGSMFADANWRPLRYGDPDYEDSLQDVESLSQPGVMATVAWWTETGSPAAYNENGDFVSGSPGMGLPIHHFRHMARGTAYGTSTIEPLVPGMVNAINSAGLDIQTAARFTGFKVNWATGFDPDVSSMTIYPGATIYNAEPDGSFGQFGESDLNQLIAVKDSFIKDAATLTATPLTYFNLTGVIPAEGTQQALELALLAKVKRDQVSFGNTWEDVIRMWLKMAKTWSSELADIPLELLDEIEINCVWEDAKPANELEQYDIAERMKALGVPDRFIFRHLGFSEDEIDQMMTEKQVKANRVVGALATRVQQMETENTQAQALALEQARQEGRQNGADNGTNPLPAE